jgi:ketosteroid isomerase-like protein
MSRKFGTLKALYACFGRGDISGILERLDPDVEWEHDWGDEPLPLYAPRRGREAVVGFFEALVD